MRRPGPPHSPDDAADSSGIGELEDLDAVEARERHARISADMRARGSWYLEGREITGPRYLAIGRSSFYRAFMERLSRRLGTPVYQSDFMEWIDPAHPHASLLYFIRTAERIDVSLEGITAEQLAASTSLAPGPGANRSDARFPYMTSWEINQLYHGGFLARTYWHTMGAMSGEEAFRALGGAVALSRIIEPWWLADVRDAANRAGGGPGSPAQ